MKIRILFVLLLGLCFFQGCARSVKISSSASSYQKTGPDGAVISEKKHTISLSYYTKFKDKVALDKTTFRMIILNRGNEPIKIDKENISVMFEQKGGNGSLKKIEVQQYDDFMSDLEKVHYLKDYIIIKRILKYIQSQVETLEKSIYRNPGSTPDMSRIQSRIEEILNNIARGAKMMIQNSVKIPRLEYGQLTESVPQIYIKPRTLMPDDVYNGILACDTRYMTDEEEGNFTITVSIDGEDHVFTFRRRLI